MKCWNKFFIGFAAAVCYQEGLHGWIGKERYLKAVDLLWTSDPWWVWLLLFLVLLFVTKLSDFFQRAEHDHRPAPRGRSGPSNAKLGLTENAC